MGALKSAPMASTDWWDSKGKRGAALLLSALVHAAVVLLLLSGLLNPRDVVVPPSITVELVPEPAKPKVEPPKPEPPKPEPPKPEAPKPEPPKPEPKPEPPKPPPPPPQAAPPPPRPWYELAKPVLADGKLAKTSHAVGAAKAIAIGEGPPDAELAGAGEATQSERDLLLAQILPLWKRPYFPAPDAVIQLSVLVRADGTLGAPFTATEPWNPAIAISHYNEMAPGDPRLQLLIGLYNALRLAQPLHLPPELKAKAPFGAKLDFRLNDVN